MVLQVVLDIEHRLWIGGVVESAEEAPRDRAPAKTDAVADVSNTQLGSGSLPVTTDSTSGGMASLRRTSSILLAPGNGLGVSCLGLMAKAGVGAAVGSPFGRLPES